MRAVLPGDCTQAVLDNPGFQEGLIYVGTNPPSETESCALLNIVTNMDQPGWPAEIEGFLLDYPASPWAPAVHHGYAAFCRRTGRITKALAHWEAGWAQASTNTDESSYLVGGIILGEWTDLLSSLGRVETLESLDPAGQQWSFGAPSHRERFIGAENSMLLMRSHPEIAYRCGTFALKAVGQALQSTNTALEDLVQIGSPTNGFSVSNLVHLGQARGLDISAVRRPEGDTNIIVPSVIHWAQNHYAALLDQGDAGYYVQDPTFGEPVWLPAEAVNAEASGVFILATSQTPTNWTQLSDADADAIRGRGLPNTVRDGKDKGCAPVAGGLSYCILCQTRGMPVWGVSEPYVNLFISDQPLSYLTSRGEPFSFQLTYKQRDTRPNNFWNGITDQIAITGWNHSWYSYIRLRSGSPCNVGNGCSFPAFSLCNATLYLPNGGEVSYPAPGNVRYNQETRTSLSQLDASTPLSGGRENGREGLRLVHADGSQDIFGRGYSPNVPYTDYAFSDYVLTRHVDPHGNVTVFRYETLTLGGSAILQRLKEVVDYDGRTNNLVYTNVNSVGTFLTEVDSPYGAKIFLNYDTKWNLTGITDTAGLPSSLQYDGNGYPTNLTTLYGTTTFQITDNAPGSTNNFGGHNVIDRALKIVEPGGATSLYLYRYDSFFLPTNCPANQVPTNTPLGTLDDGNGTSSNELNSVSFRNSFYWNPRQFASLSTTDFANFNTNDYLRARMRHWLQDTNELFLSGLLSVERDPSPDGTTEGLKTFYDYQGKLFRHRQGTNDLPSVVAWRLPGGESHYDFVRQDQFGNTTNEVTTYSKADGSLGLRTNQFIFALNTYAYAFGGVADGGAFQPVSTNLYSVPNLLARVIAADGSNIWTFGAFDSITWSNDFAVGLNTNRVILTSQRVIPRYATNAVGDKTEFSFTGFNKISGVKWSSGLTTTNFFATNGFLYKTIDLEINRTNFFSCGTNGLPSSLTNELGLALSANWDQLLRLTKLSFPDGTYVSNFYDKLDVAFTRDRLGNSSSFVHDGLDHLTAVTNANRAVTRYDWCGCGALNTITDPLTNITTLLYDQQQSLTNISLPDGSKVTYRRDLAGRVTNAIDGASRSLQYNYNNQGLVTAVSNVLGRMQSVVYDVRDRPIQVTGPDNVTVTNTFDNLDRLVTRSWPGGGTEGWLWSTNGLLAYTNQDHQVTWYGRDVAGRLLAVTNANNELTRVLRNPAGLVTNLWDGNSNSTAFRFNEYGLLTNRLDGLGHEILRLAYDANLRLTNRWTPEFGNTAYKFDPVGNLTNVAYPLFTNRYALDALNRLTNMTDQAGVTAFSWTQTGNLASEDGPWGNDTVSYGYMQGLRTNMSLAGSSWTYGYDDAWRFSTIDSPAGTFTYQYPPSSLTPHASHITLPNSAWITNHFDALARLDQTALVNKWGHVLDGYTYTHTPAGLRTNIVRDFGFTSSTVSIAHDNIGQITSWIAKEQSGSLRQNEQLGWAYDQANNLRFRTNGLLVQTFNNDSANQLTNIVRSGPLAFSGATPAPATNITVNGSSAEIYGDYTFARTNLSLVDGPNIFTVIARGTSGVSVTNVASYNLPATNVLAWDSNGNLTNDGSRVFIYDPENRLVTNYVPSAWKSEFVYDGLGRRRVERDYAWSGGNWTQTNETRSTYDGPLVIQERNGTNGVEVIYSFGPDFSGLIGGAGGIGGLLARTGGSDISAFYHADGAGNVTALMDSVGDVTARYLFNPFGRLSGQWGPMAEANVMRFSSMRVHRQSGMSLFLLRDGYDPNLQRWIQRDPIGEAGGVNVYRVVSNNPLRYADPFGLQGGVQLELDLEEQEPPPRRYEPGEMPDEEVEAAAQRLLRNPASRATGIGAPSPPLGPPRPLTEDEIRDIIRNSLPEQLSLFPPEQLELSLTYPRTGRPTSGVFCFGGNRLPLRSGRQGPASTFPRRQQGLGFDGRTRVHVEGHVAAFMWRQNLESATVSINNPVICANCQRNLPSMLPPGSRLNVVLPDGTVAEFVSRR